VLPGLDHYPTEIASDGRRQRKLVGGGHRGDVGRRRGDYLWLVVEKDGVRGWIARTQPWQIRRRPMSMTAMLVGRWSMFMLVVGMAH